MADVTRKRGQRPKRERDREREWKMCYFGPIRCGDWVSGGFVFGEGMGELIEIRSYSKVQDDSTEAEVTHVEEKWLRCRRSYRPNPIGVMLRPAVEEG